MPRPRSANLASLGPYWIRDDEKGRPGLWRYWYDGGSGRVRRARLASTTLEAAKLELAELIVKGTPKSAGSFLAIVLETYRLEVTDKLPSKEPARRACALITEFMTAERPHKAPRVAHFDKTAQADFAAWCANRFEHSVKTISRNLSVAGAALNHAGIKDHPVAYAPSDVVAMLEARHANVIDPKRRFMPSDAELGRFMDQAEGRLFRACLIMLATACRPEAALDLGPASRNREAGVLQLNPDGRRQTRKWRPIVREPKFLTAWLDAWEEEARAARQELTSYVGFASVDSLQTAMTRARAAERVKLPQMVAYSIRHKVTTILRRYQVPSDQVNVQLGHRRPSNRTSDLYGEYEPNYLGEAAAAIDAFMISLQRHTKRRLFAGEAPTGENLQRLESK